MLFIKKILKKFRRYPYFIIIGVSSSFLIFIMTFILTEYLHLWYLLSFIIAAFFAWTYNFIMNAKFTFENYKSDNLLKKYILYIKGYVLLSFISFGSVYILTSILHFNYLISIFIITIIMSLVTFNFNRNFIFPVKL